MESADGAPSDRARLSGTARAHDGGGAIDGIQEPLSRPLHAVLRRAVADHAARERRRVHPPLLHVGWPGGPEDVFVAGPDEELDHALRCDVVAALLHTSRRHAPVAGAVPMLWLTRPGPARGRGPRPGLARRGARGQRRGRRST